MRARAGTTCGKARRRQRHGTMPDSPAPRPDLWNAPDLISSSRRAAAACTRLSAASWGALSLTLASVTSAVSSNWSGSSSTRVKAQPYRSASAACDPGQGPGAQLDAGRAAGAVEALGEGVAGALHDAQMPHAQECLRPRVVGIEGERPIEQRLALLGVAVDVGADRVVQLGQLAERDRQLQLRIDLIGIERQGLLGIRRGQLEQGLLLRHRAEVGRLHQGCLGGEREALGAGHRPRQAGGPDHVAALVPRFGLAQPGRSDRRDRSDDQTEQNRQRRHRRCVSWRLQLSYPGRAG